MVLPLAQAHSSWVVVESLHYALRCEDHCSISSGCEFQLAIHPMGPSFLL